MPRRRTAHDVDIPLWLIPKVIYEWIRRFGEELEWIRVKRSELRFYTVSIRTRPIRREFRRVARAAGGAV
ncbi:MAG: hypothetical protein A4E34_00595 [Methanoregula sp. PtaU1.Bin006]|nr:MAG: hypothetical protein A4E33_02462 [Methanoregula sp. PtaB.Bin085]OPY35595.1 MAG: hypothetical protein A4E34_00595 [Methanoregula sp. PtaU1.Bin006]